MQPDLNLDGMSPQTKFIVVASMKTVIELKKKGFNEKQYLDFCKGTWESVEMNDEETLEDIINDSMKKDLVKFGVKINNN